MFFDLSSMQPEDIDRAVEAAQDYINKKMQPADLVAMVSLSTRADDGPGLYGGQGPAAEGGGKYNGTRERRVCAGNEGGDSDGTADDSLRALPRMTASTTR